MTSCLVVPAEYVRAEIAKQCPEVVLKFAIQKIDPLFDHHNHGPNRNIVKYIRELSSLLVINVLKWDQTLDRDNRVKYSLFEVFSSVLDVNPWTEN